VPEPFITAFLASTNMNLAAVEKPDKFRRLPANHTLCIALLLLLPVVLPFCSYLYA
jgi:hypothetical protein